MIKSEPINQPDLFEPYTRNEQTRQTRQHFPPEQNSASYKNVFLSQNSINTQSYRSTQMENENQLPYYLQQHEITKTKLINFSQIPIAAKSQ